MGAGDIPTLDRLCGGYFLEPGDRAAHVGLTRQNEETTDNQPGMAPIGPSAMMAWSTTMNIRQDVPG
jgi:hypothetical protein